MLGALPFHSLVRRGPVRGQEVAARGTEIEGTTRKRMRPVVVSSHIPTGNRVLTKARVMLLISPLKRLSPGMLEKDLRLLEEELMPL